MNHQRRGQKLRPVLPRQISWWYVARELPRSRVEKWERRVGRMREVEAGVWRGTVCGYPLYLVSSVDTIDENLEINWAPVVKEFGLALLIRQVGLNAFIGEVGLAKVIDAVGLDRLVDSLTPEQRARLRKRL